MRILTVKEPFATLISKKIKTIETRSWKTNYRGEIYIHAGIKKPEYSHKCDEFIRLAEQHSYSPGFVLCRCKLIDCIEMTEEYIKEIKEKQHINYICGEYAVGRFAWILDDIEIIEPFFAKGRLGIWHYEEGDGLDARRKQS